ncbi:MepB family protein [Haploplasma modicum]|uniref:MepB family protein n=1 Tax=Haploplasma modicum TaxID=2150 RepID=UPI00214C9619|nr:MepB family protein [Haploplasma modicum]MCR1809505.1 MepB family protein [Haploplasma modicum]
MKTTQLINKLFNDNNFVGNDIFNYEYEGFSFEHNMLLYYSRLAKKTPNKAGYFVTFWRKEDKVNRSFDESDKFDFLIVNIVDEEKKGYLLFNKKDLIKHGIISSQNKKGKMGFRVYPNWEKNLNSTAIKTQSWQLNYFYEYPI